MREKMSWDSYRKVLAMNPSTLVHGLKSMLHLKHAIYDAEDEETAAKQKGSVVHALLLEPEEFESTYKVMPDFKNDENNVDSKGNRSRSAATTWCKKQVEYFKQGAENEGYSVVSEAMFRDCQRMRRAVQANDCARMWMEISDKEQSLLGQIADIPCKGRVDLINDHAILDVKSTDSADQYDFGRRCAQLHYVMKMAMYQELARLEDGKTRNCYFIVVESKAPFDVAVYEIPDDALIDGLDKVKRTLKKYADAKLSGVWPGVSGGVDPQPLFIPNWAMPEDSGLEWAEVA